VSRNFAELARQTTPMGEISLRRRLHPSLLVDVYEVKLGDEHLMSSLFTAAEEELARLGLAAVEGEPLDVVVGGLGLGYTARTVLADPRVGSLRVLDALGAVIDWHREGLVPLGRELTTDPRCRLVEGDFFALVAADRLGPPGARYHAVLVDIDHTPDHVLHPAHARFYRPDGLRDLADRLHPGGVFGLWSDDAPDGRFVAVLDEVFESSTAHVVTFPNPLTGGTAANTVYVATTPTDRPGVSRRPDRSGGEGA
jgi:spermidine synthase